MAESDFTKITIETIAKRAANFCSNPDCRILTCGPAESQDRALTIGEAAHIFGARPTSARYREEMRSEERSDITNAIWLCRNCHKLVDSDPQQFPADLLFLWRREHDVHIAEQIGKRGDIIRQRIVSHDLEAFKACSYLAQQIVIDKPDFWEYKLTIELLRTGLSPIVARWRDLERGLYAKPLATVSLDEIPDWNRTRMDELQNAIMALTEITNTEIHASWGPPGTPGNENEILKACNLFIAASKLLLDWEECVRFSLLPHEFENFKAYLQGTAGRQLLEIQKIPVELAKPFEQARPSGTYNITITLDLPNNWAKNVSESFAIALRKAHGII